MYPTTHHSLHEVDLDEISPARDGPETQLRLGASHFNANDMVHHHLICRCQVFEYLAYPKTPEIHCQNEHSTRMAQAGNPR